MASKSPFEAALASLGNNSQEKGKRFEEAIKWWLRTDKVWRNELLPDSVLLWSESPFRNGPDIGIDLTAEDNFGNIWAIQVKNWNSSSPLPKSEVDKFLAASNTKTFTRRLLVSTTEAISINALRAIEDQEKLCTLILRNQLEESTAWVEFGKHSSSAPPSPKSLFTHQKKALDSVVSGLRGGGRGQLIMACGSGKTITAQRISEALDSKATLVLLPSLLLVQQTLQSWRNEAAVPFISLSVCSDESVNGDEPVSRASELPFPVTTDPQVISQFLGLQGRKVIFSTYQSSEKLEDAIRQSSFRFDLVICDEAHRLAGKVDKSYGTVFREGALPSDRYLFMTATPKVFSTRLRKIASDEELEINSMDDVDKFGQVLHTFSFAEAIENNILTDYRVVLMGVDDSMVHDLAPTTVSLKPWSVTQSNE
jgi:predicted helicase